MTGPLVECVARAMYDDSEDIYEEPWDGLREDGFTKGHYRSNAKVAILETLRFFVSEPEMGVGDLQEKIKAKIAELEPSCDT